MEVAILYWIKTAYTGEAEQNDCIVWARESATGTVKGQTLYSRNVSINSVATEEVGSNCKLNGMQTVIVDWKLFSQ